MAEKKRLQEIERQKEEEKYAKIYRHSEALPDQAIPPPSKPGRPDPNQESVKQPQAPAKEPAKEEKKVEPEVKVEKEAEAKESKSEEKKKGRKNRRYVMLT